MGRLQRAQRQRDIGGKRRHPIGVAVALDATRYVNCQHTASGEALQQQGDIVGQRPRQPDAEQCIDDQRRGSQSGVERLDRPAPFRSRRLCQIGRGFGQSRHPHRRPAFVQQLRRDITIAAIIARAAQDQDRRPRRHPPRGVGRRRARKIHQFGQRRALHCAGSLRLAHCGAGQDRGVGGDGHGATLACGAQKQQGQEKPEIRSLKPFVLSLSKHRSACGAGRKNGPSTSSGRTVARAAINRDSPYLFAVPPVFAGNRYRSFPIDTSIIPSPTIDTFAGSAPSADTTPRPSVVICNLR